MEEVIGRILKDASKNKHPILRQACHEALETLANQAMQKRLPSFELRYRCLEALQLALESKNHKLISHSLNGLQQLLRDQSSQSVYETDDEEKWLPAQLLKAVSSITAQSDHTQVEILKVLLQMACTSSWSLTTSTVLGTVAICQEVYGTGAVGVRTAALATASQILQSFTDVVQEPEHSDESDEDRDTEEVTERRSPVGGESDELVPVLKYICDNLKECSGQHGKQASPLLLQCMLAVLSSLKENVQNSSLFISFIWQQLCPLLVGLIGSPRTDKNIISSQKSTVNDSKEMGRGSGCLAAAPTCHSAEAKTIYRSFSKALTHCMILFYISCIYCLLIIILLFLFYKILSKDNAS